MASMQDSEHAATAPGPSFPPALLLLADSALPLGSFAFSSGLESYLAHRVASPAPDLRTTKHIGNASTHIPAFLSLSLYSISSSMLPYLIAAYKKPSQVRTVDNDLDASISCTVARRASIAQGRALLGVWEKAFKDAEYFLRSVDQEAKLRSDSCVAALDGFSTALKIASDENFATSRPPPNGHLAPLFALVCISQSLSLADTIWIFLFNHARAVLSAAVRAGAMGPYKSQAILASTWLKDILAVCSQLGNDIAVEDAGQCVPAMDIWSGRHELLYTRIFNS